MLKALNLIALKEELCLFYNSKRCIILLFYVDNILLIYYNKD